MKRARILIVCNGDGVSGLEARVGALGYETCAAAPEGMRAVEPATGAPPDLALVDLGSAAEEVAAGVAAGGRAGRRFDVPVVYLVGDADEHLLERMWSTAPAGCVSKPFDDRQLRLSIDGALAARDRGREDRGRDRGESAGLEETVAGLQARCDLLEAACHGVADGVLVSDADGRFVFVTEVVEKVLGRNAAGDDPDRWQEEYGIFYPDDRHTPFPHEEGALARAMRGEAVEGLEVFVKRHDRAEGFLLAIDGRRLLDREGRMLGVVITFRDITKRKEAEKDLRNTLADLRRQTELLQNVFDTIREGVAVFDRGGKYLMLNREGRRLARLDEQGGDLEALHGPFEILHADDRSPFRPEDLPISRVVRGESFDGLQLCVPIADEENDLYISAAGRPLLNADGTVRGGMTVFRDVTARRLSEKRLQDLAEDHRKQRLALETVLRGISDGVVVADEHGAFTIFNPAAERTVGIGMTDSGPDDWSDTYGLFLPDKVTPFPPEELPLVLAINGEATDNIEMFARNRNIPDGAWLLASGRPLTAGDGTPRGGVVVFRDVSVAKAREEELQELADTLLKQKQAMEAVFNSMSDGVVVVDKGVGVTVFNPSAERILGVERTSASLRAWWNEHHMFYPDRVTPFPREDYPLAAALTGRTTESVDVFVRHKEMREGRHITASGRPLLDHDGRIRGAVAVFRDVTERVRAEEAVARAFAQGRLEVVDTLLHNVGNAVNSVAVGVATLQDQLRNDELPRRLSAVAGALAAHRDDWIAYLRDDAQGRQALPFVLALADDFEKQHEQFTQLTGRVRSRVDHIVDILRTQPSFGGGAMERQDIDLPDAIGKAVDVLRDSLNRRGIAIEVDCSRAPRRIRTQDGQFRQMLVNLVKNAMDAIDELIAAGESRTPPRIRIAAYAAPGSVILDVIDTGIGIPPERFKAIFSAGYTTKKAGSGLGLHATANFVISAGGSIQPLSEGRGTGTTMRVTLRTDSESPPPDAPVPGGPVDARLGRVE